MQSHLQSLCKLKCHCLIFSAYSLLAHGLAPDSLRDGSAVCRNLHALPSLQWPLSQKRHTGFEVAISNAVRALDAIKRDRGLAPLQQALEPGLQQNFIATQHLCVVCSNICRSTVLFVFAWVFLISCGFYMFVFVFWCFLLLLCCCVFVCLICCRCVFVSHPSGWGC